MYLNYFHAYLDSYWLLIWQIIFLLLWKITLKIVDFRLIITILEHSECARLHHFNRKFPGEHAHDRPASTNLNHVTTGLSTRHDIFDDFFGFWGMAIDPLDPLVKCESI